MVQDSKQEAALIVPGSGNCNSHIDLNTNEMKDLNCNAHIMPSTTWLIAQ